MYLKYKEEFKMGVKFSKKRKSLHDIVMQLKRRLVQQFESKEMDFRKTFGDNIYDGILCTEFEKQVTIENLRKAFIRHDVKGTAKPHLVMCIETFKNQLPEFKLMFDFADNALFAQDNEVEFSNMLSKGVTEDMTPEEITNIYDKNMLDFILTREESSYSFFYVPGEKINAMNQESENGGVN